jgi:hypothetical protein
MDCFAELREEGLEVPPGEEKDEFDRHTSWAARVDKRSSLNDER